MSTEQHIPAERNSLASQNQVSGISSIKKAISNLEKVAEKGRDNANAMNLPFKDPTVDTPTIQDNKSDYMNKTIRSRHQPLPTGNLNNSVQLNAALKDDNTLMSYTDYRQDEKNFTMFGDEEHQQLTFGHDDPSSRAMGVSQRTPSHPQQKIGSMTNDSCNIRKIISTIE